MEQKDNQRSDWHLDKSVSIGHIITTLALICGVVVWMMEQSGRITKLETQQTYVDASIATLVEDVGEVDEKVSQILIRLGAQTGAH